MSDRRSEDQENELVEIPTLELNSLKVLGPVGRGAKGVVFRVRLPDSDEDLALKVVLKASFKSKNDSRNSGSSGSDVDRDKNKTRRIWFEREVLRNLRHPLLPRLHGVLETDNVVGYAIDYCPGQDLNSVRRQQSEKMFSDDIIRFYAAELVLALEYLHKSGIVYRDLKPENVLIQENGHLMLVDFDLSTKLAPRSPITRPSSPVPEDKSEPAKNTNCPTVVRCCSSGVSAASSEASSKSAADSVHSEPVAKSNSFVGTEDYVAPEVVAGKGHDYAVDWWCLGVVLYEMLYGKTPFRGSNRKETFFRIVSKKPDLVGETTPLRDLIRRLLEKDPGRRIQLEEIKGHEFFKGVDWEMIWRIQRPPFIPLKGEVEEGIEGINGIEVERIVHGIFEGKKEGSSGNNDDVDNKNRVWVEGLDRPSESDNFMVF
ncbi:hypothetical protein V2J09_021987 [Rumex salicifolius]